MNMQRYMLTIRDLFTMKGGDVCGAKAEIAILDGDTEVDRVGITGKVGPGGSGYQREYKGKPGLRAELKDGVGQITFMAI
ncbi:hypothetical protein FW760_00305 [Pseudomonas sp. 1176_21]